MITDNLFLSICIPTYNRINKTLLLVNSILEYDDVDIEVVVLDNCSSDNTERVLGNIKDNRFRYIRNKHAVGGMQNILSSLTQGNGEYVMLCLDKDRILPEKISEFIIRLKRIDVIAGHCSLNNNIYGEDIIYEEGLESVLKFAYKSEHPSGLFINKNILKKTKVIENLISKDSTFAFLPELVKAEIAIYGKTSRINMPLVYTETLDECEMEISHTYKDDNIYFFPKNIIKTFNIYICNLHNLKLSNRDKRIVFGKIFSSLLLNSTLGFYNIMKNKSICLHHGIEPRNINILELIRIDYFFSEIYFKSKFPVCSIFKIYYFLIAHGLIIFYFIQDRLQKHFKWK